MFIEHNRYFIKDINYERVNIYDCVIDGTLVNSIIVNIESDGKAENKANIYIVNDNENVDIRVATSNSNLNESMNIIDSPLVLNDGDKLYANLSNVGNLNIYITVTTSTEDDTYL